MRINPQGTYARAIGENDYLVPRGGYFFEVHCCRQAPPLRHSPAAGRPTAAWMPPILQHLHNGGPSSVLVLVSS